MSEAVSVGKRIAKQGTRLRDGERFFDSWSPQMAWCLGVVYECGAADPEYGIVVESSDRQLLKAFRQLVRESRLYRDGKTLGVSSAHVGERLCALGMEKNAFRVRRVPRVPEEHVRYLVRGILDCHEGIASFDGYLADIRLELPTRQRACLKFLEHELEARGYHFRREPRDIDFKGIASGEPASYIYSLSMSEPREIIDCYRWLFGEPCADLPFTGAQRWVWTQLRWMLRDIEACAELLKDEELMKELRQIVRKGMQTGLMGAESVSTEALHACYMNPNNKI